MAQRATAYAPASIGNVGVGFDVLGLALEGAGDRVVASTTDSPGVHIGEVLRLDGKPHPYLSTDPAHNTASIAVAAMWDELGIEYGVEIDVHKGVPLQSGMGSSAASAVAATVAANALLPEPLPPQRLLPYALEGEKYASGGLHADNVAPSLLGGLVLCPAALLPQTIRVPAPAGVSAVLMHPELTVNTAKARRGLARGCSMQQWIEQQGYLAAFITACYSGDVELIRRSLLDVIIEPQRAAAVACFDDVKAAALRAGALGCSLSGSGPSIFALAEDARARNIAVAMEQACRAMGIECQSWVSPMTAAGARVED